MATPFTFFIIIIGAWGSAHHHHACKPSPPPPFHLEKKRRQPANPLSSERVRQQKCVWRRSVDLKLKWKKEKSAPERFSYFRAIRYHLPVGRKVNQRGFAIKQQQIFRSEIEAARDAAVINMWSKNLHQSTAGGSNPRPETSGGKRAMYGQVARKAVRDVSQWNKKPTAVVPAEKVKPEKFRY